MEEVTSTTNKSKKKTILIIVMVAIIAISAVIAGLIIAKNFKKNKSDNSPATNVSDTIENRLLKANQAIIDGRIPYNYNGEYKFKYVSSITFNEKLTLQQIKDIAEAQGTRDPNGLATIIERKKKREVQNSNEIIKFYGDGVYQRSTNSVIERGEFVGNDDLAEVRVYKIGNKQLNTPIKFEMSKTCIKGEQISEPTSDKLNPLKTHIYLYKNYCSEQDPNLVLFTITYVYELLPDTTLEIPNSKLDVTL